jgi:hypothetical protein
MRLLLLDQRELGWPTVAAGAVVSSEVRLVATTFNQVPLRPGEPTEGRGAIAEGH